MVAITKNAFYKKNGYKVANCLYQLNQELAITQIVGQMLAYILGFSIFICLHLPKYM